MSPPEDDVVITTATDALAWREQCVAAMIQMYCKRHGVNVDQIQVVEAREVMPGGNALTHFWVGMRQ